MIFYKTVSSGNDFFQVDVSQTNLKKFSKKDLAKKLCSNHFGAGADGVVYYKIRNKLVDFEIFNKNGTEAELSGNGMAGCSALLFYLNHFKQNIILNTKVGKRSITLLTKHKNQFRLEVEIGEPDFENKTFFPFLKKNKLDYIYDKIKFYPVSVGNPHIVVILKDNLLEKKLITISKKLENAAIFPQKTNIEFILIPDIKRFDFEKDEDFKVFFYERGVGKTIFSSTGSCAVFSVLNQLKLIHNKLTINTSFNKIKIYYKKNIYIENITKIVYKGTYLNF